MNAKAKYHEMMAQLGMCRAVIASNNNDRETAEKCLDMAADDIRKMSKAMEIEPSVQNIDSAFTGEKR